MISKLTALGKIFRPSLHLCLAWMFDSCPHLRIFGHIVVANIWMAFLLYGAGISDRVDKWFKADASSIEDLKTKETKIVEEAKEEIKSQPQAEKQSARDRLKDKGLM